MAAKKKAITKPEGEKLPRQAVPCQAGKTEEETERNFAAVVTSPELAAYRVIKGAEEKSGIGKMIDTPAMLAQLRDLAAAVNRGDLKQAEAMLMNQATALQSLFARLAERGMGHDQIPGFEANMRMALRAQSQCRATLETLAAIKNPPVIFAKQANISNGPQQVNNGAAPSAHVEKNVIRPNELLEVQHGGKTMDARTAGAAIGADPQLETVDTIHRA